MRHLGWLQWKRFSDYKFQFAAVDVPTGVLIQQNPRLIVVMSVWMLGAGAIFFLNGDAISIFFVWLGGLLVGLGILCLVLIGVRAVAQQRLQFAENGLVISERGWRMTLNWLEIRDV